MAALNKAISERRFKQVRSFIDLGVNLNSKGKDGKTALIQLCSVEPDSLAVSIASRFIKRGAKIDVTDYNGLTALSNAVLKQKEDMVALFLEEAGNFDLNSKDKKGNTALFHAANVGNFNILNALVLALKKYQLSVNVANNDGVTPLMQACLNGDVVCARYLIKEGKACLNSRDWIYRKTALELAKMKGIEESVLMSNGGESPQICLSGERTNENLTRQNHFQRKQKKVLEEHKQPVNSPTEGRRLDRTYKDQLQKVYRIYECQLTASFKMGKKPKTKIPESTTETEKARKMTSASPKGRSSLKSGNAFKLLKRNSVLADNISRAFPFQSFQRSQSFTDLTKLNFKDSERLAFSSPFPRSRSPLNLTRSGRVRYEPSGAETRSVSSANSIPTVFETNELDE
ncbi:hypothetical protein ACROYT_G044242 [Oculina patagonica]